MEKPQLPQFQALVERHHSMVMAAENEATADDGGRPA